MPQVHPSKMRIIQEHQATMPQVNLSLPLFTYILNVTKQHKMSQTLKRQDVYSTKSNTKYSIKLQMKKHGSKIKVQIEEILKFKIKEQKTNG